jgi:regulator of cell morphogenesis and NO signaling
MNLVQKKIGELIAEDYQRASVLFFFGIHFYNYSENTLEQVCREKGLNLKKLIKNLERTEGYSRIDEPVLKNYPVDLIIEYLKHSHYIFIKQKLPYLLKLISGLENKREDKVSRDLKFIFPFFAEDFIHHVYEEEDTLFSYILTLNAFQHNKASISKVYFEMEKHSIREYALEHTMDDDEMAGIRALTLNYSLPDPKDLHLLVIFEELKAFERELQIHARVENEILFPKALCMENDIRLRLKNTISSN